MTRYGTRRLFEDLSGIDGRRFATYEELEEEVIRLFNQHLWHFPPGYSYMDALEKGWDNRWYTLTDDGHFFVQVRQLAHA